MASCSSSLISQNNCFNDEKNCREESLNFSTNFTNEKNLEISENFNDGQGTGTKVTGERGSGSGGGGTGGGIVYPPFPCPFCDRAYASWGFRRRHIKAVHTISPRLNCKWCLQVLPTHGAWRRHVVSAHNLSASDAHNGLLILEEAHMVLQIANPTRLDTIVNIIKENSRQGNNESSQDLGQHHSD